MSNEEKRSSLIAQVDDFVAAGIVDEPVATDIKRVINDYFDNLRGEYNPTVLAGKIKEELSATKTMDLGAGIAIGIIIGVMLTR